MFDAEPENLEHCELAIVGPGSDEVSERFLAGGFAREARLLDAPQGAAPAYGARGFGPYWLYRRVTIKPR